MPEDNQNNKQPDDAESTELLTDAAGGIEVLAPSRRWWQITTFEALGVRDFRWFWFGMLKRVRKCCAIHWVNGVTTFIGHPMAQRY